MGGSAGRRGRARSGGTRPLSGRVAVVAGATRGAGRGIARGLGEAGAVVYCTGRSTAGAPSPYRMPETLEETAAMVTAAGGTGIALPVDHTREAEVEALFTRVMAEQGRLDLVVDSVAGEDPRLGMWGAFWDADLSQAAAALEAALVSHLVTAKHAARAMVPRRRGLIVEVVEGDFLVGAGSVLADVAKTGLKCLVFRMAEELHKHRVAALAITPGFLRSENMLRHFGLTEATWREGGKKDPHFLQSESPLLLGRAVAALAADPKVLARSGGLTSSWELAREFDLTDANGERPDWGRHWRDVVMVEMPWMLKGTRRQIDWLEGIAARLAGYCGAADDSRDGTGPSGGRRSGTRVSAR